MNAEWPKMDSSASQEAEVRASSRPCTCRAEALGRADALEPSCLNSCCVCLAHWRGKTLQVPFWVLKLFILDTHSHP